MAWRTTKSAKNSRSRNEELYILVQRFVSVERKSIRRHLQHPEQRRSTKSVLNRRQEQNNRGNGTVHLGNNQPEVGILREEMQRESAYGVVHVSRRRSFQKKDPDFPRIGELHNDRLVLALARRGSEIDCSLCHQQDPSNTTGTEGRSGGRVCRHAEQDIRNECKDDHRTQKVLLRHSHFLSRTTQHHHQAHSREKRSHIFNHCQVPKRTLKTSRNRKGSRLKAKGPLRIVTLTGHSL